MQLALARTLAFALTAASTLCVLAPSTVTAQTGLSECVVVQPLDGSARYVSDPAECTVKTSPASTFKIPHALIALETGVVPSPLEIVNWDETLQPFREWERGHSLDSAVKWSVVWFFQRTAEWIGRQRMLEYLEKLGHADRIVQAAREFGFPDWYIGHLESQREVKVGAGHNRVGARLFVQARLTPDSMMVGAETRRF
jgi:beta-lactamase class D